MIPVNMLVRNFKAITGPHTLPLRELGIVHVLGQNLVSEASDSNGASKTALMISAPCWCFTGRTEERRRVVGGAAVRNRFTDGPVVVEVEYDGDDGRYHMMRTRSKQGMETVKLVGPHGRVWDAKHDIEERLGFDWSFFTNVIAFGPDTSARFSQAVDSERKEIFDRIIPDMERLNTVFDRADMIASELRYRLGDMDSDRKGIEARLDEIKAQEQILEAERGRIGEMNFERWLENMRQQRALHGKRLEVYEELAKAVAVDERMKELRPKVDAFADLVRAVRAAESKVQEQSLRVTFLKAKLHDNEAAAKKLLAEKRCPCCLRRFDKKSAQDIIGAARFKDGVLAKQVDAEYRTLDKLDGEKVKLAREMEELEAYSREYDQLNMGDLEMLREDLEGIDRRLKELEDSERPRAYAPAPSRRGHFEEQLRTLASEAQVYEKNLGLAQFVTEGRVKLKSRLLDGVEEYLDERLRHYSSVLSAGEITIGFAAQTKLKKGTHKDKIAITAEHLFGAADLDLHSSGERQRIDLALVLTLQDLARQQHGTAVRLSLFDEVFDHLDETGVERLMELMAAEKAERGTVEIVTQNPRISAHPADHQVVVQRTREGTRVLYDEEEV